MKKCKWLLALLGLLGSIAFSACSISGGSDKDSAGIGGGYSSGITDDGSGNQKPSDNEDIGSGGGNGAGNETSDNSNSNSSTTPSVPVYPDVPDDEIPEGKILVRLQFFTFTYEDSEGNAIPLSVDLLTERETSLSEFLAVHMETLLTVYNEANGYYEGDNYYTSEFFTDGFWQVGDRLMRYEHSFEKFLPSSVNSRSMYLLFTPSGWGPNVSIVTEEDGTENYSTIPFPIGICLQDFVDWALERGFFEWSYAESVTKGTWKNASGVVLDAYSPVEEIVRFEENGSGEGGGVFPQPTEFTVWMPSIYNFEYDEMGGIYVGGVKDCFCTVYGYETGIMIADAMAQAGDNSQSWVYYINGERVEPNTYINQETVVVCVLEEIANVVIPSFTVSISAEGCAQETYVYSAPVTPWEVAQRYFTQYGLNAKEYVYDSQNVTTYASSEMLPVVSNTSVQYVLYKEPVLPTESSVTVTCYDGNVETVTTYVVPYGITFEKFVQENFWSEYTDATAPQYEYAFFGGLQFSGATNEIGGYEELRGTYRIWMIKRSVLETGYNVSVDLLTREGVSEAGQRTMYFPCTIRMLVYEVTYHDVFLDTYYVTINGVDVSENEKLSYFEQFEERLYYTDLSIVIRPKLEITVYVEAAGEEEKGKTLVYTSDVTAQTVASDLGLSRNADDYLWFIGWDMNGGQYVSAEEPLLMRLQSGGYLFVKARKVLVNFTVVMENGDEMSFNMDASYGSMGWAWSVTAKAAYDEVIGSGEESFDEFTWTVKTPYGDVYTATADTVLSFIKTEYTGYESDFNTVYTLIGNRKYVTIEVVQQGGRGEKNFEPKVYAAGTTVGQILAEYGFTKDDYDGLWTEAFSGVTSGSDEINGVAWTWDSQVTRPMRIIIWFDWN